MWHILQHNNSVNKFNPTVSIQKWPIFIYPNTQLICGSYIRVQANFMSLQCDETPVKKDERQLHKKLNKNLLLPCYIYCVLTNTAVSSRLCVNRRDTERWTVKPHMFNSRTWWVGSRRFGNVQVVKSSRQLPTWGETENTRRKLRCDVVHITHVGIENRNPQDVDVMFELFKR